MRKTKRVHPGIFWSVVFITIALVVADQARAEDDLLQILDGKGADTGVGQKEAQQSVSALKVLIGSSGGASASAGGEANIFLSHFEKGDFERAFFHWPVAFGGQPFAASANGRALYGLLLVKNGLAISGLETLFSVEDPTTIAPALIDLWKQAVNDQHPAWSQIHVAWKPAWTTVFGTAAEVRVVTRSLYGVDELETLKEAIKKTSLDTRERATLQWQLVLALAAQEQAGDAAKILNLLMKAPNNPISQDLMTITAARLLFQNGYLDAALQYYGKIPKTSDYWLDAQEEMGWTEMRKGRPQNSLAITRTLVNPVFNGQVGPEAVFLQALSQLKVCDYPGVVDSLKLFRERFRTRAAKLIELQNNPTRPAVERFIQKARATDVKLAALGADIHQLPRFVTRDQVLRNLITVGQAMEAEGRTAADLFARSMNYEGLQPGSQAHIEEARKSVETRVRAAKDAVYARMKILTEEELTEIGGLLQKMHIVETEVLQHISLAEKRIAASRTEKPSVREGTTGSQNRDRIWFPAESETWFDEFANFKVDLKKGCQAKSVSGKAQDGSGASKSGVQSGSDQNNPEKIEKETL